MEKEKHILIVAGEASGDLHAANLVKAIKEISGSIRFSGLGGEKLKAQGVNLYFDITALAVVGFFEVLKNLQKFRAIFKQVLAEADKDKPDLAILVDYPGFNIRLAEELKIRNIPIIYYISPQVWAWGAKRVETIKRLVSRIIVVFKFEEELYRKNNVPVSFVGHPLLDIVRPDTSKEELFFRFGLDPKKITIALLPGSREIEVTTLLPIMLKSAELILEGLPQAQFLLLRSPCVKEEIFKKILSGRKLPVCLISDMAYSAIASSDFALVASGTATLETAILGVPMAIVYKVSFLTWAYIRMLIKIPYIGLVNVVKQEKFIAEFIQYDARPQKIAAYAAGVLNNPQRLAAIKEGLSAVGKSLGEKGASLRAARIITDFLGENADKSR